jgi:hypothetical protein
MFSYFFPKTSHTELTVAIGVANVAKFAVTIEEIYFLHQYWPQHQR